MQLLALFAAPAGAGPWAGEHSRQVSLGVTATVIRPAEITSIATDNGPEVVTVTNSGEAEVAAEGGTLTRLEGDSWIVSQADTEPVVVTITY